MNKIREIIRLHEVAAMSARTISRALGVSRPVVAHYLSQARAAGIRWSHVEAISDEALLERLQRGREPEVDPRLVQLISALPRIVKELGRRGVTRQLLWEEYRNEQPQGYSYSQFCFHLQVHTQTAEISMHLHHEPGQKLFVDFAGRKPTLIDPKSGAETPVELFVAVFPASGLIYIEATIGQDLDSFTTATRHTLEYAGGSPRIIVPDNLKAAVITPDRYEPVLNDTFEDFARHYGCAIVPARVRKPRDKALVEAAVNLVYTRVLARLRDRQFATLEELNAALWEHLGALNDRAMKLINVSRRQRFEYSEREQLQPLPLTPYILRRFEQPRVQLNYHVYLRADRHYYSVPHTYRRKTVKLAYSARTVEIYHNNERIAAHRRDRRPHGYTTTVHHMPSAHRTMVEWTPERFRRWARGIGAHTEMVIAAQLAAAMVPEQSFKRCLGILSLAKRYGADRLEAACRRADQYGIRTYRSIKSILEKGLEHQQPDVPSEYQLPLHDNIRGAGYYGRQASEESR